MSNECIAEIMDGYTAVNAVDRILKRIDKRLINHGERVAYIAREIADYGKLNINRKLLHLLCIFHDIGAYKTDEIDRMLEFETNDVQRHSVYGYLFLKYLSPLEKQAEAIFYHHTSWKVLLQTKSSYAEYAALIYLADRIDIYLNFGSDAHLDTLIDNKEGAFCPEYVLLFNQCRRQIVNAIFNNTYQSINQERLQSFCISTAEAAEYLKMVVYSIDFRSENTVTHTINTVSIAVNLAKKFGLEKHNINCIYLGALLHDVGKISIPLEILEFSGKLDDNQMTIMRTHVMETEKIITGIVPDEIVQLAIRHHEKLDGTGYPNHLTSIDLDLPQRIIAVADIISALGSRRSYKEPFPYERVKEIISQMSGTKLDAQLCDYACSNYEKIKNETDSDREQIIDRYQSIKREFSLLIGNKMLLS